MRADVHVNDSTISVYHQIVVKPGTGFTGSQDLTFRWDKLISDQLESYWNSSYRPIECSLQCGSLVGTLGQPDGYYASGSNISSFYQRPALKIQQYSKISILIIISTEEIKKPLKIFYL